MKSSMEIDEISAANERGAREEAHLTFAKEDAAEREFAADKSVYDSLWNSGHPVDEIVASIATKAKADIYYRDELSKLIEIEPSDPVYEYNAYFLKMVGDAHRISQGLTAASVSAKEDRNLREHAESTSVDLNGIRRMLYVRAVTADPKKAKLVLAAYADSHLGAPGESLEAYVARCAEQDFDDEEMGCLFSKLRKELDGLDGDILRARAAIPAAKPDVDASVLTHAAYLMHGFMEKGTLEEHEANAFGGQIGAVMALSPLANVIARALQVADSLEFVYNGVVDYEVTEGMGAWFRANLGASDDDFKVELIRQLDIFFEDADCRPISEALLPGKAYAPAAEALKPEAPSDHYLPPTAP